MVSFVLVGTIVSTHGIKGELKIISDTNHKNKIFKIGHKLYIDNIGYEIIKYRVHKNYDLVTFKDYEDINLIADFLQKDVYINKDDILLAENEYLYQELIGLEIIEEDKCLGKVITILKGVKYDYLEVENQKRFLIPLIDKYIVKVNLKDKKIITKDAKDLIF